MCGILGELTKDPQKVSSREVFSRIVSLMNRRGPDDKGQWTDGKHCSLGFCRLSILDLTPAGHQPMHTSDGRYVIVYNGEVYNFKELRGELEKKGLCFRSAGDTEVVLNALTVWGIDALKRFNGMFALALYDTAKKSLFLARDHAGIKPIYYLNTEDGFVFASQFDQILTHRWSRNLDFSKEAIALYLRLGYIPAPYALLKNSYKLEPGTFLEITIDGKIKKGGFFEFPAYKKPDIQGQEASEAVNEAVSNAVRRQMVSDVPIGAFLSGGIDSPLIVSKLRSETSDKIQVFTLGTNVDHMDESTDAIAYAREIGVEHSIEQATQDHALNILDDVITACGEPFGDYSIFPTLLISKLAGRKVKVMLSGDGGDELFWGYVGRFSTVLKKAKDFQQPYWMRSARWGFKKFLNIGDGYWNLRWPTIGDWYRARHSRIPETWLLRIFPELPLWPKNFDLFSYAGWEPDKTAQWLRWNEFIGHLTMVLDKVDRASMYHSLEVRVPLLDLEVVRIATRVDWQSCLDIEQGFGKLPLRHALASHVKHQTQAKRGFSVPMESWLRGPLRPVFEDTVLKKQEILGLPINRKALGEMFQEHLSGKSDYGWGLWILLSLALWKDKHHNL